MMRPLTLAIGNLLTLDMLIEDFQTMTTNWLNQPEVRGNSRSWNGFLLIPFLFLKFWNEFFPLPSRFRTLGKLSFIGPTSDHYLTLSQSVTALV